MLIQKRTMNWLPKLSAFDHAQQQTARRQAMTKSFIAQQQQNNAALLGSFNITSSQSKVELIINQAVQRITAGKKA